MDELKLVSVLVPSDFGGEGILQKSGPFILELSTCLWPRRRGSWRRIQGEQVQTWLLLPVNGMSEQISKNVCELENVCCSPFALWIIPCLHPNWEHTQKSNVRNAVWPSQYYILQSHQSHLCFLLDYLTPLLNKYTNTEHLSIVDFYYKILKNNNSHKKFFQLLTAWFLLF